jgi:futalosine hydrolase
MRVLVLTAVIEEAEAVLRGLGAAAHCPVGPYRDGWLLTPAWGEVQVLVGGVGPAAAAASAATALARSGPFDLVIDAGIAGGFPGRADTGDAVLADCIVAADLGAELPADDAAGADAGAYAPPAFLPLDAMGFGEVRFDLDATLVRRAAEQVDASGTRTVVGTVLTVSTVTGTPGSTARLAAAHPGAAAEGMEGFGVVTAAAAWGVPTLELRTICNPVGVSDRASWDLPRAFAALEATSTALLADAPSLLRPPTGHPGADPSGQPA